MKRYIRANGEGDTLRKSGLSADAYVNHICKVIDDGRYTTFFLTTDGEQGYWYWITDTPSVKNYRGTMDDFVNDDDNYNVGYSVAYFDTLEDAIEDFNNSN